MIIVIKGHGSFIRIPIYEAYPEKRSARFWLTPETGVNQSYYFITGDEMDFL